MPKVLITAYGPYDEWDQNASWLVLQELTRNLPAGHDITTRRYQVDFDEVKQQLAEDLASGFDVALHLGQAPGAAAILLEAFGVNVRRDRGQAGCEATTLIDDGPPAFRSELPLEAWATALREAGILADVSFHAGDYLCNAAIYLSHYYSQQAGQHTRATFVHLPLDSSQALNYHKPIASLPAQVSAEAIRMMLATLPSTETEGLA